MYTDLIIISIRFQGSGQHRSERPTCMYASIWSFVFLGGIYFRMSLLAGSSLRQKGYWLLLVSSLDKKMWAQTEFLRVYPSFSLLCATSTDSKCHCCSSHYEHGGFDLIQEVLEKLDMIKILRPFSTPTLFLFFIVYHCCLCAFRKCNTYL